MGDHDKARRLALLVEYVDALLPESGIPHRGDLVSQIDIEVKCHADRKRELRLHPARITFDRQFEVLTNLGEGFDPLLDSPGVMNAMDTADKAGIFAARHASLKTTAQGQWPRHPAMTGYLAFARHIHAPKQAQQGGFARSVGTEDPDILVTRQGESHILQDVIAPKFGRVIFGDVFEGYHNLTCDQSTVAQAIGAHRKRQQYQGCPGKIAPAPPLGLKSRNPTAADKL